jgi:hypothetical protein
VIWATRRSCHVDRTACAWLIRRFVDPGAQFVFVSDPDEVPPDATPFDMRGAELGHRNGGCSFETFLTHYDLGADAALGRLARIVHEADLGDERFDAPEAPGLDLAIRALGRKSTDDELIELTTPLYEALYLFFGEQAASSKA